MLRLAGLCKSFRNHGSESRRTVLSDICLEVQSGESVAILGENGAGKSVLLKLICGILQADAGSIDCEDQPVALIELGAAFNAERNARENLRDAFALHGLEPDDLNGRVAEAIDFSGIDSVHLDKPVKQYSSGMLARLGFAFVAACRPTFLITDEVLAVGDEPFQRQCVAWLEQYVTGGGTLFLVSHNLYHVQRLCTRAIWLHEGRVRADGDVFDVSQAYLEHHEAKLDPGYRSLKALDLKTARSESTHEIDQHEVATIEVTGPGVVVELCRLSGEVIYQTIADKAGSLALPTSRLLPGRYCVQLKDAATGPAVAQTGFRVTGSTRQFGSIDLERSWA